jgi:uncharacterized membrane protein YoaT (DUF817 family)
MREPGPEMIRLDWAIAISVALIAVLWVGDHSTWVRLASETLFVVVGLAAVQHYRSRRGEWLYGVVGLLVLVAAIDWWRVIT